MSQTINITLSGDALAVLPRLKDDAGIGAVIAKRMDRENQITVGLIQRNYLSFPKTGPTTSEGLRRISTPGFASTLYNSPARIVNSGVYSSIGTPQKSRTGFRYPALHEFGGEIPSRPTRSKNKSYARRHPNTKAYSVQARRPIQRGIADRADDYGSGISSAILTYWKGKIA